MILSLLRVRDFKVEDMMRSSFSEFASQQRFPELKRKDELADQKLLELTSKQWPEGCALNPEPFRVLIFLRDECSQ